MASPPGNVCEEERFSELFLELSPALYRFLYYRTGESRVADDLVQEAFLKLWEHCDKVLPGGAKAYVYRVAANLSLKLLARKQVRRRYAALLPPREGTNEDPQRLLEEAEFAERLRAAIAGLPDGSREVFLLHRVEGLKYREIAERLGITQKAVEKRMHRALLDLRQLHAAI